MSENTVNAYSLDRHVTEIYDQHETQTDDVELIRRLIGSSGPLRILEPFCGTGRILIQLAADGHEMVGMDQSEFMLDRALVKIEQLAQSVRKRITLQQADVTSSPWPSGFDLVLLGGNCFYELASPEEQEASIVSAAASLNPGGFVYVDNDHMEGELDESWCRLGERSTAFPTGVCADGARVEGTTETFWFDRPRRLSRCRRTVTVTLSDGTHIFGERIQQKHPVSFAEVRGWLATHGFSMEQSFGDRAGTPYTPGSPRAIFWAKNQ